MQIKSLVDTGSTHNYITQQIIDKTRVKTQNLPSSSYAEMANGETIKIDKFWKLQFTINENPNTIHIDKFRIIPKSNTDMILGMSFLQQNNAMIDKG